MAGQGPRAIRVAARRADIWNNLRGRDPASIRRSVFAFRVPIYESVGACEDWVGRMLEAGIRELVLWYPGDDRASVVLERFAADSMPRLRAEVA